MTGVVRRTLRCTPAERAEIRERAAALDMPVSGFLVACALHEDAGGPGRDEPRLVLSEEEQRTLYERVEKMDRVGQMTNWPLARLPEVCGLGSVTVMASSSQANICSPLK